MKLMKGFFDPEEFYDQNSYFCKYCNKHSKLTTKKSIVKKFPPYLIITLKRFLWDQQEKEKKKITDKIRLYFYFHLREVFPELNVSLNDKSAGYKLYAVIMHMVIIYNN